MSSNSCRRILQTAPIVSALRGPRVAVRGGRRRRRAVAGAGAALGRGRVVGGGHLAHRSRKLSRNLPIWISSPSAEQVRLDPLAVHVGAVERAEVVDVGALAAAHDQRVVAGDGDVVEEDRGVGRAADAHPLLLDREALAGAAAAAADDQRGALLLDHLLDVDALEVARLIDRVSQRRRLVLALGPRKVGAALLAVVGAFGVDEAALVTVQSHMRGAGARPRRPGPPP